MKHLFTVIFGMISLCAAAQFNGLQTQYARNPFVVNPACAGEQGFMSATLSARRQWLGFEGAPETFVFSVHTPVKKLQHNLGLLVAQDNLAIVHRTTLSATYAYRIVTPRVNFSAGISPGVELWRNNWSQVQTTTAGDAAFGYTEQFVRAIVGYGLYANSKHFFIGVSSRVVAGETITTRDQPFMLYTGVRLGRAEKVQFTISNLTRMIPGGNVQTDVNVFCMFRKRVAAGVGYRHKDAWTGMLQVQLNDQFSLGYAYDYTVSELRNYSSGSHEILLRYDFGYTVHRSSPR